MNHSGGLPFSSSMRGGGRARADSASAVSGHMRLPPNVKPLPVTNEASLRKGPDLRPASALSRRGSASRVGEDAGSSTGLKQRRATETQFVYLVSEQNKEAPEYKEQKRRLIRALTNYRSPSATTIEREGLPTIDNIRLDKSSSSSSSGADDSSGESSTETSTTTCTDRGAGGGGRGGGGLHIAVSNEHGRSTKRESRKRKELMKALQQPVDDLCAVPDVKIDDKALLAPPKTPTNLKSPRAGQKKHFFNFPPIEPYEGGAQEISRLGHLFTPAQALDTALDTAKHFLNALSLDFVSEAHQELGQHLQKQVANVAAALDVARTLMTNQVAPMIEAQGQSVRSLTQLHAAEKYQAAALHNKVITLQATMRGYGIVPTVHGVPAPDPSNVTIVLCDIPHAPKLWSDDPDLGQSTMDVFSQAARSLLKDHQGYEVAFGGWSLQLAFASMQDAVNWCLSLHSKLLGVSWPKKLLAQDAFAADNKLCWCGLAPRMAVARGTATTVVDPESQVTKYYGEPLLLASHLLRYSALGTLVTTATFLQEGIRVPLAKLATSGGAAAHSLHPPQDVLGQRQTLVRMTPHALKARLLQESSTPLATGSYFLGITHRPSDLCVEKIYSRVINIKKSDLLRCSSFHVRVDDLLPSVLDDLRRDLVTLREGLDTSLSHIAPHHVNEIAANGKSVIIVVVKLARASILAQRHPSKLVSSCEIFMNIVRQVLKKTRRSIELSFNLDVATILFMSRQEAIAFAVKLHATMAMANWEDTVEAWNDANAITTTSDGKPINDGNEDGSGSFEMMTSGAPKCSIGIDLSQLKISADAEKTAPTDTPHHKENQSLHGFKPSFTMACILAGAAVAGETLTSDAFKDASADVMTSLASVRFLDQGKLPIGTSGSVEQAWSIHHARTGQQQQHVSAVNRAALHFQSVSWPNSSIQQLGRDRLKWTENTIDELGRQISNMRADAEKSTPGISVCPMSKEAVFVSLEANVTVDMWFSDHKCVLLEALRILQKAVRVLLIDIEDGYELFSDQQAFMLCFHNAKNAVRFSLELQERLAATYWGPGFQDVFPQCGKVLSPEGSIMWNGIRVRCSVVSQREGITLPVVCDSIRSTGRTIFFGRPVFLSAKLCSLTSYGQILIDEITHDVVKGSLVRELRDPICIHAGNAIFAGRLQGDTKIFSLVPRGLAKRPSFDRLGSGSDTFSAWLNLKLKEDVVFGYHVVPDGTLAQTVLKQLQSSSHQAGGGGGVSTERSLLSKEHTQILADSDDGDGKVRLELTGDDEFQAGQATLRSEESSLFPNHRQGSLAIGIGGLGDSLSLPTLSSRFFSASLERPIGSLFGFEGTPDGGGVVGPSGGGLFPTESGELGDSMTAPPTPHQQAGHQHQQQSALAQPPQARGDSTAVTRQNSSVGILSRQSSGIGPRRAGSSGPIRTNNNSPQSTNIPTASRPSIGALALEENSAVPLSCWKQVLRAHAVTRRALEAETRFLRSAILREKPKDGEAPMTDDAMTRKFLSICREEQLQIEDTTALNDDSSTAASKRFLAAAKAAVDESLSFPAASEWGSRSPRERERKLSDVVRSMAGHVASFHLSMSRMLRAPAFRKLVSSGVVAPKITPRMVDSEGDDDDDDGEDGEPVLYGTPE